MLATSSVPMTLPGLGRGERAPDMVLPAHDGTPTRYYAHAGGRPAVLVFADASEIDLLRALSGKFDTADVSVHVVGPPSLAEQDLPYPVLRDDEGKAALAYRTAGQALAFLLDRNLRVRQTVALSDAATVASAIAELVDDQAWDSTTPATVVTQAPVLVVPDVLDATQCEQLVAVWEQEGSTETGVEASTGTGRAEQLSAQFKRRRDHIMSDQQRTQQLAGTIGRRVMPELAKAFTYRASRFEGFKIACYEASQRGFFRAHRDNLSPTTAHRRFALTLNLNDDYEGGELRFPEYGPELYRPPRGGALLFSCSLLHEVLDVTAGRRFVLLSFLFSDERRPA